MGYLNKVISKIRQGALRDIYEESCWIYRYARKYRSRIFLFILLGLLSTGTGLVTGLVSRQLINMVVAGASETTGRRIAGVAGAYVALGVGKILLGAVSSRVSALVDLHVNREIRAHIYRCFLSTGWQSISGYHTGDLMLRLDKDVSTVASGVLGWVPSLITGLAQFLGALLVILWFDPWMALFALISVPVSTLLMGAIAPRLRNWGLQVQEASSALSSFYNDSLGNIQSVKAFGLVDIFSEKLEGLQKTHLEISLGHNRVAVLAGGVMSLAGLATSCLCLGWGVYRLWTGRIDFGTMVLFIQLAGLLASAATGLIRLGPSVISTMVSAKRLMTILELPAEPVEELPQKQQLKDAPEGVTVTLEEVSFAYRPEQTVLEQISFEAGPGMVTAVVGPSGSGKTTLLRLLLCLTQPQSGTARIRGGGVEMSLRPGLRELFSYVPQQKALFSGTVAETLRLGKPEASQEELWEALRLVEMDKVVAELPQGLDSPIGEDGGALSQGQGQRLSIARAMLRDAPVLLLDEATSALDVAMERRILRNIMACRGSRTVIVTTHRPTVLTMCSRVYEIRDGKMQLLGPEEVGRRIEEF